MASEQTNGQVAQPTVRPEVWRKHPLKNKSKINQWFVLFYFLEDATAKVFSESLPPRLAGRRHRKSSPLPRPLLNMAFCETKHSHLMCVVVLIVHRREALCGNLPFPSAPLVPARVSVCHFSSFQGLCPRKSRICGQTTISTDDSTSRQICDHVVCTHCCMASRIYIVQSRIQSKRADRLGKRSRIPAVSNSLSKTKSKRMASDKNASKLIKSSSVDKSLKSIRQI